MHENSKNIYAIFFSIIRESKLDVSLISPNVIIVVITCSDYSSDYITTAQIPLSSSDDPNSLWSVFALLIRDKQ